MTQPSRPAAGASRYQAALSALFLVAVVLMATQYAVVLYGPAKVLIAPLGWHGPEVFAEEPAAQAPGLYVINWRTLDQVAYKLDDGRFLPPAEGVVALLFLLALPALLMVGWRRQVWPRYPVVMLVLLGLLSCLSARSFGAALRENVQLVLTALVTWWLAGLAVVDGEQAKRLNRLLAVVTVLLVAYAGAEYWFAIIKPAREAELPELVRATCASRTAFSGLMTMLLALGFGRVLAAGNFIVAILWIAVCAFGAARLMAGGAVLAVLVAGVAMMAVRGLRSGLVGVVLVPLGLAVALYGSSGHHLDHLRASLGFYRYAGRQRVGVEKRYLEMAASYNGLGASAEVTAAEPDATGSLPVTGTRSNLLTGVGAGLNYQQTIGQYYGGLDNPEKQEPDTYNLYLQLALQMGLFAALAWAWLLLDGAASAWRAYELHTDRGLRMLALGIFGACVGLLVFSVFGTVLVRGTGLLVFTLLGVAARLEWLGRPVEEPRAEPAAAPAPAPAPA
ncbi:MAG: hypothetical protein HUU35_20155, partial [Armatimonadetes bacterium]|nr:hypothetical protein [Armatimonadota bacterium]